MQTNDYYFIEIITLKAKNSIHTNDYNLMEIIT